ncbi:CHRD domain-containing protein [Undibacterium terreum]|uniref:CHRD domain-containing protein n=1 Tax=Undibacterium terreum TaxID=1224302 RepID=A0A916XD59_9BURK|nr:CHRD domain-containing protein [Undibacterium terreum]GGC62985.1 CHRD domain-containing protein [Undibacterium terreum]
MNMQSSNLVRVVSRLLMAGLTVALVSCANGGFMSKGSSSTSNFKASLTGASEVPANASTASGSAKLVYDPATKGLTVNVMTTGIAGKAAHIHQAAVGVNGGVIFPLAETPAGSGNWGTSVTLSDEQLAVLQAGGYYINVHSAALPGGEIRGQIVK